MHSSGPCSLSTVAPKPAGSFRTPVLVGGASLPLSQWKGVATEGESDVRGKISISSLAPAAEKADAPSLILLPPAVDATIDLCDATPLEAPIGLGAPLASLPPEGDYHPPSKYHFYYTAVPPNALDTGPVPHATPPEHVVPAEMPVVCPSDCARETPPAVIGATARSKPPPRVLRSVEESAVMISASAAAAPTAPDVATEARSQRVASRALVVLKTRASRLSRAIPAAGGWGADVLSSPSIIVDILATNVRVMMLPPDLALLLLLCAALACVAISFKHTPVLSPRTA